MKFTPAKLTGSYEVDISPIIDDRGWFTRIYCKNEFSQIGHSKEWVQINHSFTTLKGSVRGMHYQLPPYKEIKLVRCVAGAIFDVIIDLRKNSATFLQWFGSELSAKNKKMLYIPEGFAHGFQTLTDECELIYHHSEFYNPSFEAGIRHNDPLINIQWPLTTTKISDRDSQYFLLNTNFKGI